MAEKSATPRALPLAWDTVLGQLAQGLREAEHQAAAREAAAVSALGSSRSSQPSMASTSQTNQERQDTLARADHVIAEVDAALAAWESALGDWRSRAQHSLSTLQSLNHQVEEWGAAGMLGTGQGG